MAQVKAFAALQAGLTLSEFKFPQPELGDYNILVDVTHCGICHSDLHKMGNDWVNSGGSATKFPLVPGHEVVGNILEIGAKVTNFKIGQRVGFGAQGGSCQKCLDCKKGDENLCSTNFVSLYDPNYGGYADKIVADSRFAIAIPDGIESEYVAPLLCAGATVFTPLLEHNLPPNSRIGVIGIGGLGHLALQFASKLGYHVTAISTSPGKEAEARSFGAHEFLNSTDADALKKAQGSLNMILCTASNGIVFDTYLKLLAGRGKFVLLGLPDKPLEFSPFSVIFGNKTIAGSLIGGTACLRHMLEVAVRHNIRPLIELVELSFTDLDKANAAIQRVNSNKARFRVVLKYNKQH